MSETCGQWQVAVHYVTPEPNEADGKHRSQEILRVPLRRTLSAPDLFCNGRLQATDIGRLDRHIVPNQPYNQESRLTIIRKYFAKEHRLYVEEHNENPNAVLSQCTTLLQFKAAQIEDLERLISIYPVVGIFSTQLGFAVL